MPIEDLMWGLHDRSPCHYNPEVEPFDRDASAKIQLTVVAMKSSEAVPDQPKGSLRPDCLTSFNLNCLVLFATLYQEKNVSRAAKLLKISQPAVSNGLAKLRVQFQDVLFSRANNQMTPTPLVDEIAELLMPLLVGVQHLLTRHRPET
ncbi:TPA: LysR family transcriptional regulator [Pseudomonas putida]|uniref:LysR family transcriptional regulator n=1 Tax=Pseudomonas putida TaxID=303 RepID=UPI00236422C9|nr:LysR family transcriptional regulator [Pseudomonas putida]MDD2076522.1 LysR family transcriptional regulator [Pseudomonas putida]HDS1692440.1 LysR family transcriptional regulator [Pseudomonas putida]